ncbi:MAG: MBL fold metallo-hydrolase [Eubacterium sp.]|nr:MBL fold metallo-hydrolase [Eubacterium sp.]
MRNKKFITTVLSIIVFALFACTGYYFSTDTNELETGKNLQTDGTVVVHYLDVGQGDSEFIQLPDGKCMLIDASISDCSDRIIDYISNLGYSKIDYLIATHPHADHIGGMKAVVQQFDIGEIYMPKASSTSKTYENLLLAIAEKGLSINTAKAGTVAIQDNDLTAEFLAPVKADYDDLNNYSAVLRLQHGSNVFLFMGDAEDVSENEILKNATKNKLKADVLKVGHHGSKTSSTFEFVSAVSPRISVVEVGKDNSYKLPSQKVLNRLSELGSEVLRTDINGNVAVVSDKTDITVYSEKE